MIENKLEIYRQALEEVTAKLTARRSELHGLSQMTVDQFNRDIPELKRKSQELSLELTKLTDAVTNRKKEFQELDQDLRAKYNALEKELRSTCESKLNELNKLIASNKQNEIEYKNRMSLIENTESILKEERDVILSHRKSLELKIAEFNRDKQIALTEIENLRNKTAEGINKLEKDRELFKHHCDNVALEQSDNLKYIQSLKSSAEDSLARAIEKQEDAANKLNAAVLLEEKNKARTGEINELSIKVRSDIIRNSKRTEELNRREEKLKEREENLKLLEADKAEG